MRWPTLPTIPFKCRCGEALVIRTNRQTHELFIGCSGFPRCRTTLPAIDVLHRAASRLLTGPEQDLHQVPPAPATLRWSWFDALLGSPAAIADLVDMWLGLAIAARQPSSPAILLTRLRRTLDDSGIAEAEPRPHAPGNLRNVIVLPDDNTSEIDKEEP